MRSPSNQKIPGTKENQADCLYALAITLREQGNLAESETLSRQSLALYQTIPGTEENQADCCIHSRSPCIGRAYR